MTQYLVTARITYRATIELDPRGMDDHELDDAIEDAMESAIDDGNAITDDWYVEWEELRERILTPAEIAKLAALGEDEPRRRRIIRSIVGHAHQQAEHRMTRALWSGTPEGRALAQRYYSGR